jgi:hypothetical protein
VKKNKIRMIIPVRVHSMGYWDNGSKKKVVALNCGFQNQLESCSKILPSLIYEVKDFQKCPVLFLFCVFLNENNTKQHDHNTFRKLREGAKTIVSWEQSPKKEGAYPKT